MAATTPRTRTVVVDYVMHRLELMHEETAVASSATKRAANHLSHAPP
jgi:hypothetical protein